MTLPSDWMPCLTLAVFLGLEVALVVGLASGLVQGTRAVLWRRALWQAATLALLWLAVLETTGLSRHMANWARARLSSQVEAPKSPFIPSIQSGTIFSGAPASREEFPIRVTRSITELPAVPAPPHPPSPVARMNAKLAQLEAAEPYLQGPSLPWPELVWIAGIAATLSLTCLAHLFFLVFGKRQRGTFDGALLRRVALLAPQLGIRRRVRVVESSRFRGPVAFGIFWPTIGLPKDFTTHFSEAQQEVMLAHELAHVAGHDPAWQLLADVVAALMWWHPLVWRMRRQLRITAESAADEASLLVKDGPGLLAECLLQLASGAGRQPLGSFGATGPGFRSALGRRIEKLVHLKGQSWSPLSWFDSSLMKAVVPLGLVLVAVLATAWAGPQTTVDPMKTLTNTWRRSIATVALLSATTAELSSALRASPAAQEAEQAPTPLSLPSVRPGFQVSHETVLQDARLLLEMGHLDEAEAKLKQEQQRNPSNRQALQALADQIQQARQRQAAAESPLMARYALQPFKTAAAEPPTPVVPAQAPVTSPAEESTAEDEPGAAQLYQMDPRLLERYGLKPPANVQGPAPRANARSARISRGKQQIQNKLNETILSEIRWDGLPLMDVVKLLEEASHPRDPSKPGINFLVTNVPEVPSQAIVGIDPTTGTPIPSPVNADISSAVIRLHLRDVRLKDVLDAMTRVADQPIKYSVEDYGIVFAPGVGQAPNMAPAANRAPESVRLQVKTFRVDTNTFFAGLENAFGITVPAKQEHKTAPERDVQQALRQLLQQLGVNLDFPGKAVFYNELTGIVMVRATADDLELVQAAIETLGGKLLQKGVSSVAENPSSSEASVSGAVNRTGLIDVLPSGERIDLVEGIARSGGFSPLADRNKIELSRRGSSYFYRFNELKKRDADQKVWLEPQDLITVHAAMF